MASAPQSYKRGSQDIRENRATFELFWSLTKISLVVVALILIGLAYAFT